MHAEADLLAVLIATHLVKSLQLLQLVTPALHFELVLLQQCAASDSAIDVFHTKQAV